MNKINSICTFIMATLCPLIVEAVTFDDMLMHKASRTQPFLGYDYKNIKWLKHTPNPDVDQEFEGEADARGQIDIGLIDLDGDKHDETIKVIWGYGVSDHSLTIELYKDDEQFDTLKPIQGIQPNFKINDVDGDGKLEIIIWGGNWDPRLPGEDDVTEETYEGHSGLHRYIVATYKLIRGQYQLWDIYTTKMKYEPFCKEQPK